MILDEAKAHGARHGPLHRHRRQIRAEQLTQTDPHAQAIAHKEMQRRDGEACQDWKGEDAVGYGYVEKGDDRHPRDIQRSDHDSDRFGAEPIEPAEREFTLLVAGEAARAGQKPAPVLAHDLKAAIGPAVTLLSVSLQVIRQQAMAIAA